MIEFKHTIKVKIIPNAPKNELKSTENNVLKIAIAAPPKKNKANQELIKFFKKQFKLNIRIKSGTTSREKTLEII